MARSAVLIHNPGSGQRRSRFDSIPRLIDLLRERGVNVTPHVTTAPGDATRLAAQAVADKVDIVLIHGGDGTVNEALQGLIGGGTALALWPAGTANVLAREIGLSADVERVADIVGAGRMRRVSVGRAGERYFLLMAGVGMDAAVVRAVNPGLKRLTGEGAYWMAGLKQLTDWRPERFLLEIEGQQYGATFAVVANAASYGGGLRFAPHASMDDEVLDLCLFDSVQRHRFARYIAAAFTGSHLSLPGVTCLQARRLVAHGTAGQFVQVDGELHGPLPMSFECIPAALSLLVP
jgi:diacylglycerol kinase (ATP)